jgi:D-psicose/D-tagatose/L-ribulose 3-epimerase
VRHHLLITCLLGVMTRTSHAETPPPTVPGHPIGCLVHAQGTELEQARAAGFEYFEIGLRDVTALPEPEFERLLARAKALGVPFRMGLNFLPPEIKVVGPSIDRTAQDEYLGRALARGERLGLETILFGSGKSRSFPEGFSREQAFGQLVEFGQRAARAAGKHHLTIMIEALGTGETNTINSVPEAVKLVQAVGHPAFRMAVDFYHLGQTHETPAVLLGAGKVLRHVRIANPAGRAFPMAASEADYAGFFAVLRKIGYRGGIGVEAHSKDFAGEAPRSVAFLRTQAAALR